MQLLNFSNKLAIYTVVIVLAITDMQQCGLHVPAGLMQPQICRSKDSLGGARCCSSQELQGFLAQLTQSYSCSCNDFWVTAFFYSFCQVGMSRHTSGRLSCPSVKCGKAAMGSTAFAC